MRHIIWRNRASAILGLFVVIIPFTGFPEVLKDSFVVLLGVLIVIFGFYRGSGNYALVNDEIKENEFDNDLSPVAVSLEESTTVVMPIERQNKTKGKHHAVRKNSWTDSPTEENTNDLSPTE